VTTLYNTGTSTGNGSVDTGNIVLQYTFDQPSDSATGTIIDVSGKGNDGTPQGTNAGAVQLKTDDHP
jgi:hypothetical protein